MNYLPDDVLVHILFFLPTVDAIRTSSLSKRWKYLWKSSHNLDFNLDQLQSRFELPRHDPLRNPGPSIHYPVIGFLNMVHDLLQYDLLQKVSLRLTQCIGPQSIFWMHTFNDWVCTAATNKVQEFDLTLCDSVQLPQCFFTNESLSVLKLTFNSGRLKLPETMALTGLKVMHLVSVHFSDENLTRLLLSGCPVLEDLVIKNCTYHCDFKLMEISSLSLKKLVIKTDTMYTTYVNLRSCGFKLSAPQLKYFKYKGPAARICIIGELSCIKVASVRCFSPCKNKEILCEVLDRLHMVEVLKICGVCTKALFPSSASITFSYIPLHRLRHLKLKLERFGTALPAIFSLLNSCSKLETLVINLRVPENGGHTCFNTYECGCCEGVQPRRMREPLGDQENREQCLGMLKLYSERRLQNLRRVEMTKVTGGLEVDFLEYLIGTQVMLEKVCISLAHICPRNQHLIKHLKEFPRASPSLSVELL